MNIYEKLQTIRVELQKKELKKSGKNSFAKYDYYELGDFLPLVNQLCLEHKITPLISFKQGEESNVTLTLVNMEDPSETIIFYSPMRKAEVPGAQDIQNLGAEQTYQRRYLYMIAFEIVENDMIDNPKESDKNNDCANKKNDQPKSGAPNLVSEGQKKKLYAMAKCLKMSDEEIKKYIFSMAKKEHSKDLTNDEIQRIFNDLENKIAARNAKQKEAV